MVLDEVIYKKKRPAVSETTSSGGAGEASPNSGTGNGESRRKAYKARATVSDFEDRLAKPLDRIAAIFADLVLFVPTLAVFIAPLRKDALLAQLLGNETEWLANLVTTGICTFIAFVFYQTLFISIWGCTPGKRALGIQVESIWDGRKPRPMAAFIRAIAWCTEFLAFGTPSIAVFGNDKRRPFHDRIADTVVVVSRKNLSKAAGLPTIAELSMGSGATAACLAAFSVFAMAGLSKLHHDLHGSSLTAEMEEKGLLCKTVGEAKANWTSRDGSPGTIEKTGAEPTRLAVALALFGAEGIDETCLETEADYSIWRNEDKTLAYLGKALAHADDESLYTSYLDKTCNSGEDSPACGIVHILRRELDEQNGKVTDAESKAQSVADEQEIDEFTDRLGATSPDYFKVWVIRRLMDEGRFTEALESIDQISPNKTVGYFYARERIRALWNLERKEEARLALRSSIETFDPNQRVEIAQWFCFNENTDAACTVNANFACGIFKSSVDHADHWFENPAVAATYIRSETCGGGISSERVSQLEEKIPGAEAKTFLEAFESLKNDDRPKAVELLTELASDSGDAGPFYIEANAALTDLASSQKDLQKIKQNWMSLEPSDDWRYLGLRLTSKLTSLKAWDQALDVGLKMIEADQSDRLVYKSLVVAAFRAGNHKMALGFLQSLRQLDSRDSISGQTTDRAPASAEKPQNSPGPIFGRLSTSEEFEVISQELSRPGRGRGPR